MFGKKKIIFIFIGLIIILTWAAFLSSKANSGKEIIKEEAKKAYEEEKNRPANSNKIFPLEEIGKHNTREDCWMMIYGNIYDFSRYLVDHPGGDEIIKACGQDISSIFDGPSSFTSKKHDYDVVGVIKKYHVGLLDVP